MHKHWINCNAIIIAVSNGDAIYSASKLSNYQSKVSVTEKRAEYNCK